MKNTYSVKTTNIVKVFTPDSRGKVYKTLEEFSSDIPKIIEEDIEDLIKNGRSNSPIHPWPFENDPEKLERGTAITITVFIDFTAEKSK